MRCQQCEGHGYTYKNWSTPAEPCPHCNGSGIEHCCEGDQATVEPKPAKPKSATK